MCAIIGINGSRSLTASLFKSLLLNSESRGDHATGIYISDRINSSNILKGNLPASKFIETKEYRKNMKKHNTFNALLGHTRFATHGDPKNNENNHPHFNFDRSIIIVHNGVVYGSCTAKLISECDSEKLAHKIAEDPKNIQHIYDTFSGSFAVIFINRKDQSFNFFHNEGSPMFYTIDPLFGLVISSTKEIMESSYENIGIFPPSTISKVPENTLFSCRLGSTSSKVIAKAVDPIRSYYNDYYKEESYNDNFCNYHYKTTQRHYWNKQKDPVKKAGDYRGDTYLHDFMPDLD